MNSGDYDSLVDTIGEFARQAQQLARQAVHEYSHEVDAIINSKCTDSNRIQRKLDYMLDFGFDDGMLVLYKRLCRYLYSFDPAAAVDYVQYYREMWDSEGQNNTGTEHDPSANCVTGNL